MPRARVAIVETTGHTRLCSVGGLGDLSHASVVYSRDARYAFVFGRDGGLSKVDLLTCRLVKRIVQAGNSIGGAISQDGALIAVSNYEPGGVKVFRSDTLEEVADLPAAFGDGRRSKVVGLVDIPGQRFVYSLFDADEIRIADLSDPAHPQVTRFTKVGHQPYDGTVTPDGRYYLAGLFGEDGLALLDLWHPEQGVRRVLARLRSWRTAAAGVQDAAPRLSHLGRRLPVRSRRGTSRGAGDRCAQLEGGGAHRHPRPAGVRGGASRRAPGVGELRPSLNDTVQVIDVATLRIVETLKPGPAVLHMEFTPRGEQVWVSVRDADRVVVYDTAALRAAWPSSHVEKPSGIFFTARAQRIGL